MGELSVTTSNNYAIPARLELSPNLLAAEPGINTLLRITKLPPHAEPQARSSEAQSLTVKFIALKAFEPQ